jgi:hypothetical protein
MGAPTCAATYATAEPRRKRFSSRSQGRGSGPAWIRPENRAAPRRAPGHCGTRGAQKSSHSRVSLPVRAASDFDQRVPRWRRDAKQPKRFR